METFYFTFADSDFYDDIANWRCDSEDPRFHNIQVGEVPVEIPSGWEHSRRGIWSVCAPDGKSLIDQGWKLHVAVTPDTFARVLHKVRSLCHDTGVTYKHLAQFEHAWLVNAKYAPRAGSGKGIVLYPETTALAETLAARLADDLGGVEGPRILSDLRVRDSVVHARYGAFKTKYCRDDDGRISFAIADPSGRLVPDRRSVPFAAPNFVTVPAGLAEPRPSGDGPLPPYRIEKTLHFSNSGGVYLATHTGTGQEVVLKEARPFAGYDLTGGDAVRRARREAAAMRTFAHLAKVPDLYGQFTWQTHLFTVMERIRGNTLQEWCAAHHPYLMRAQPFKPATDNDVRHYRDRVAKITSRVRHAVESVWAAGYVVGDLHPGNVMVTPDLDVRLIDLEACLPEAAERPFPGAPGFIAAERRGRDSDRFALAMMELSCYLPLSQLVTFDDGKLTQLLEKARTWFGLSAEWADGVLDACTSRPSSPATTSSSKRMLTNAPDVLKQPDTWRAQMTAGFARSKREDRPDRLYPGDPSGFSLPPEALATGAAGVLWALAPVPGEEAERLRASTAAWISNNAGGGRLGRLELGLFDSALGAAIAMRRSGDPERARTLLQGPLEGDWRSCGLSLFSGVAGMFLALLDLSDGHEGLVPETTVEEVGDHLAHRAALLRRRCQSEHDGTKARAGLMHGLAGVALATHRYGLRFGVPSAIDSARALLESELTAYIRCADGSLQYADDGKRSLAYLEEGSCGAALVLAELSRYQGFAVAGVPLRDLVRALTSESMLQAGLFRGRAGHLAGLAQLARDGMPEAGPLVRRHLEQLPIHEIRPHPDVLYVTGAGNFRLSCDFRSGGAGVLTAVDFALGRRTDWLPAVF